MSKCVGIDVSKQHLDWVLGVNGKVIDLAGGQQMGHLRR